MGSLVLAVAMTLAAGPVLDQAGGALRRDPVFVHPDAGGGPTLSPAEADRLRRRIASGPRPVFVAVLPREAADEVGGLDRLPAAIGQATGLTGTFAVVTAQGFRAASNDLPSGAAPAMATAAFQARGRAGVAAVLEEFVARVQAEAGRTSAGGPADGREQPAGERSEPSGGGRSLLPLLLAGGAVGGLLHLASRRRRQRAQVETALSVDREDLRAELAVVADDVVRLEDEVTIHPGAREDYEAGVARFRWAQAAVEGIDSPDDVPRVRRALAEASYAMSRARAAIRGDDPPLPPAGLRQPGPYGEPAVDLDEERRPVYAGYGGGWGGGGFFGGNDLFAGILLGQMLGGLGWGGGFGWGGGHHDHGGDPGAGGGDPGAGGGWPGDAGGGDWGGGDFGGGDVGGGDWN